MTRLHDMGGRLGDGPIPIPRDKNNEIGLMYNDIDLKINWPVKKPIISQKDKENYSLKELKLIL